MADITIEELEKAARNIERISAFIGERRDWIVGDGGEEQATAIKGSAKALAKVLVDKTGVEPDPDFMVKLPNKLEPSAKVSAARLSKFLAFLDQLRGWLTSENDAVLPDDNEAAVQAIHGSLLMVHAAVESLLAPIVAEEPPPPKPDDLVGEIDDSPVFEVDTTAKLELEEQELKPLTQTFQGVTELTVEAKKILEGFLAAQNVTIEGHDLRRLHDKLLKWIEGIPLNQILVVKLSGLSGKPNVYSSYQPKGGVPVNQDEDE
jgi:hypothetical protein